MKKQKEILFCDYYDEWVETYKEGSIADITLQKYYMTGKHLRIMIPKLLVSDLDRREYQKLLNEYALTHEKQTTTDFHHHVKSCIQDMFHDGLIERDPTYKAVIKGKEPRKKKKKFLQTDELSKLVKSLDLNSGINRDWLLLITAKTGLRFAEVLALTPADFDFENQLLNIDKSWNYKNTKGFFQPTKTQSSIRKIAIDWQIVGQFKPLIEDLPQDEPIFIEKDENGRQKRVFNSTYNNWLANKCKELEIPVISLHSLRHTHASVLMAAGVSIHSISQRLGHADVGVTQETYAHVLNELREADNQKMIATLTQL